MGDIGPSLTLLVVMGVIGLVIFLVMRQLLLWYWRINEMADNIAYIAHHYRTIDTEAGRRSAEAPRKSTGAGSPFAPRGISTS